MTQEETLQYNKRCAEFLGWKIDSDEILSVPETCKVKPQIYWPAYQNLIFHSDWNWIMEVKDMIQRKFYFVDILGCGICTIKGIEGKTKNPHISAASDEPKEAVVQAINQFLIWYNENSNKKD